MLVLTYSRLLPKGNIADLTRIMDLKGLKKGDQAGIISAYNRENPDQVGPIFREDESESSRKYTFFTGWQS